MNPLPAVIKDSNGGQIRLGRQIGKGGEGAVFETQNHSEVAVKLYWPNKAASRRDKIAAMVASAWSKSSSFVAYPIDALYTPAGVFAGFAMRRVDGHKPVHLLYSPSSRKLEFAGANFRFLILAALNAARAVASVHATDCVIGDKAPASIMSSERVTTTISDWQFSSSNCFSWGGIHFRAASRAEGTCRWSAPLRNSGLHIPRTRRQV